MSHRTCGSCKSPASRVRSVRTVDRSTRLGLTDVTCARMCRNGNRSNIQNRRDANQTIVGAKP